MELRWHPHAVADVKAAIDYCRPRWPGPAMELAEHILAHVAHLADFPNAGRPGFLTGTRELVVPRFPLLIVYEVTGEVVTFLRVYHQSQRLPGQRD
ncbi:MAG: type II toxin-antitoxin system RelE/ParE family toxin [Hyphomicrobiaceae bacterium]|nr:type II toxin-antitoxin system RelE/ParE family toxin [Hyphomicrobiaceae bacterium]